MGDTATIAFTVMPDHIHWLFELGNRLSLGRVIARFKSQTRSALLARKVSWQRDFFEHRLRVEESVEDYALYIFLNPYRAGLISHDPWPCWWTSRAELLPFLSKLNEARAPPAEWLGQPIPDSLVSGEPR